MQRALGVDLGGTKIYSVAADEDGTVLGDDRRPTEAQLGPDGVIARIVESLRAALDAAGLTAADVAGVGISSPGPCDPARGIVTDAPNLPGWHNIHVTKLVGEAIGLPALLENDAAAACYGEFRFGAGRGKRHVLYLTLGTGIGGGIIIDGALYRGASGAAGEVGHLVLVEEGPPCNCGGRGCLEALAAGPAIARDAGMKNAEAVHEAAEAGDESASQVIERAGRFLGLGLTGLLNTLNPEALILGGGLVALGDRYIGTAMRTVRERSFAQVVQDVTMTTAELGGDRAGALGAAALVLDGGAQ